jgi:hypothetical protein
MNTVVKAHVCDFRPERIVFVLGNAARNDASLPSGSSSARAMQRSGNERKGAIFTIDNRRARGLSSEKIFVAVRERSLSHATEAGTASHTAPQWVAQSISIR